MHIEKHKTKVSRVKPQKHFRYHMGVEEEVVEHELFMSKNTDKAQARKFAMWAMAGVIGISAFVATDIKGNPNLFSDNEKVQQTQIIGDKARTLASKLLSKNKHTTQAHKIDASSDISQLKNEVVNLLQSSQAFEKSVISSTIVEPHFHESLQKFLNLSNDRFDQLKLLNEQEDKIDITKMDQELFFKLKEKVNAQLTTLNGACAGLMLSSNLIKDKIGELDKQKFSIDINDSAPGKELKFKHGAQGELEKMEQDLTLVNAQAQFIRDKLYRMHNHLALVERSVKESEKKQQNHHIDDLYYLTLVNNIMAWKSYAEDLYPLGIKSPLQSESVQKEIIAHQQGLDSYRDVSAENSLRPARNRMA